MAIAAVFLVQLGLYSFYRAYAGDPSKRSLVLYPLTFSSIIFWSLLAVSFALCSALLDQYTWHPLGTVRFVFGSSLLASLALSLVMTMVARRFAYPLLLKGMVSQDYAIPAATGSFHALSRRMKMEMVELHNANRGDAFSIRSRRRSIVAISPDLVVSLSGDELEAVLAHELSHLKNRDSFAKGLARLAKLAFPFDPTVRLVEAATHRERELLADRIAVRFTSKPLALASALLHVHSLPRSSYFGPVAGLFAGGKGHGLFSLYPELERRIQMLLDMDKNLRPEARVMGVGGTPLTVE